MKIETMISRRKLLASAPAAAAIGVPSVATALGGLAAGDDDELLALGRQMEPVYSRFYELNKITRPLWEEYNELLSPYLEACKARKITDKRLLEIIGELQTSLKHGDETLESLAKQMDDLTEATDQPFRRIIALPAHTLAGVAVKAKSAAFACEHFFFEEEDDADWDHKLARSVIKAVLALAGERLPWDIA